MGKTIPRSDGLFDGFQEKLSELAWANRVEWGLPVEWLSESLLPARDRWRERYEVWKPKVTRNAQMTFEKRESRAEYESLLRRLIELLRGSPLVTDEDRMRLGIYIPPHSNIPLSATDELVGLRVSLFPGHRIVFTCFVQSSGTRTKPHGVLSIEFRWGILPEPVHNPDDLPHVELSTRTSITLDFDQPARGGTIYYAARWIMRNSRPGPWNDVAHSIIP
jgi:hypothetical protein